MLKFPDHYGDAELQHNDHLSIYQTVTQMIEYDKFSEFIDKNWVSLEEKQKAINTNELWSFHWREKKGTGCLRRHASTLAALMESFGLDWGEVVFHEHKAGLYLKHNEQYANSETISQMIEDQPEYYGDSDWVSLEEKQKSLDSDEIWTIHWYPNSPVGFSLSHASSLDALFDWTEEEKKG